MLFRQTQKLKFLRQFSTTKFQNENVQTIPTQDLIKLSKEEIQEFYTKNLKTIFTEASENKITSLDQDISDLKLKFQVLSQVVKRFGKNIPSPLLKDFQTGNDVCKWFVEETEKQKPEPEVVVPPNVHLNHTTKIRKNQIKDLIPKKQKKVREEDQ